MVAAALSILSTAQQPAHAPKAQQKVVARLQDLLGIVRKTVYLSAFNGSYSIKDVGPALDSDLTYAGLNISGGSKAAAVYQQLVEQRATPPPDIANTLSDLRIYCARDIRLAQRRIGPAHVIAWSIWRRAHQAEARRAHIKRRAQL
jgi:hypothetical protein